MDTIIIILLAASIILFIISFLQPDKVKSLEKEVEQLNMTILQEQYLVKKRLKVLEEELLMEQNGVDIISRNSLEPNRSEEHTSELQSRENLVCRLLLEKKKKKKKKKNKIKRNKQKQT